MKKFVALLVVGMVAAAMVPGTASAGKKKKKAPPVRQELAGSILMQAPPADATDNPNGCFSGVHRRLAVATGEAEQANGIVGYHFAVDEKTWNLPFRLTPGSEVDIDITFYAEFGTVEQAADTAFAPFTVAFEERNNDGEFGKVPPDMTRAIVCMKTGQQATFDYVAGTGVK